MNTTKWQDLAKIENLRDGDECRIFWFEEGGGVVKRKGKKLFLYEYPQYGGGESSLHGEYDLSDSGKVVDIAWSWT